MNAFVNKLKIYLTKNFHFLKGSIVVISVTILYQLCFFNRYFPVSEGWYHALGQLLNNGAVLYRDIPWIFPPVYPYLMAFLLKIGGSSFLVMRLIGLCWFTAIVWFLYDILTRFFNTKVATLSTLSVLPLYLSQVVFISYDYYPFYLLMAFISCFLLIKALEHASLLKHYKRFAGYSFVAGIFATLAILTRQNSGFFTMVFPFIALCLIALQYRKKYLVFKSVFPYLLGIFCTCLLIGYGLYKQDALLPFMQQTMFAAAQAKGGAQTALFAWFLNMSLGKVVRYGICVACIGLFVPWLTIKGFPILKRDRFFCSYIFKKSITLRLLRSLLCTFYNAIYPIIKNANKIWTKYFYTFLFVSATACIAMGFFTRFKNVRVLFNTSALCVFSTLITLAGIILFVLALYNSKIKQRFFAHTHSDFNLLLVVFCFSLGLIWGVGTSYAIAIEGAFLAVAFVLGYIYQKMYSVRILFFASILFICLIPMYQMAHQKASQVYTWWGLGTQKLANNTWEIDLPELKGIYTFAKNKQAVEQITQLIKENSSAEDTLFTFPQIPLFYYLADRKPTTYALVHWFDVSLPNWVEKDYAFLKQNPPKLFVYDDMNEWIYSGHEKAFNHKKPFVQRKIKNLLDEWAKSSHYELLGIFSVAPDHKLKLYKYKNTKKI